MTNKIGMYVFTLLGLFLGVILDYFVRSHTPTPFYPALLSLFCFLYALSYNDQHPLRLIGTSFITALFLALPIFHVEFDKMPTDPKHLLSFAFCYPLFIYIAHCFHYAIHRDNTWQVKYHSLFEGVWNTIPALFVATVFAFLAKLLIVLGALVFKSVGFSFLWDVYFNNHHLRFVLSMTLFFMGLGISQQNAHIIYNLRFLLLRMMYFLFPVLAFITILYCILLTLSSLTGGAAIDPLLVLIPLSFLGIVFFNATYQDGTVEDFRSSKLGFFFRIYRVFLLITVTMMLYRLYRDFAIESNFLLILLAAFFYALAYAISAWVSAEDENTLIQKGNIATALFLLLTLFLMNLPYVPIEFTVGNKEQLNLDKLFTHF